MEYTAETPEAPVSTEIPLKYSVVKDLRDKQQLSFAKIAEQLGSNAQSVEACYKAKQDRVYRPRGPRAVASKPRAANGNRTRAKNGNAASHSPAKPRSRRGGIGATPATSVQAFTDRLVSEMRERGVWKLAVDLREKSAEVHQDTHQKLRVHA